MAVEVLKLAINRGALKCLMEPAWEFLKAALNDLAILFPDMFVFFVLEAVRSDD